MLLDLPFGKGIPRVEPEGAAPRRTNLQNEPKRRILIAEDSVDNQILMRAYFDKTPYTVEFASDGQSAVELFAASAYDLVLMDVQMPGMDGWTAVRAIRALERERGLRPVPVIALTARAQAADEAISREAGCQEHLSKPVSRQALFEAMGRCFGPVEPPAAVRALGPGYLQKRREEVALLLELVGQGDYERIATVGHNWKGTGAAYGFPGISVIGAEMEEAAKMRDGDGVRRQVGLVAEFVKGGG